MTSPTAFAVNRQLCPRGCVFYVDAINFCDPSADESCVPLIRKRKTNVLQNNESNSAQHDNNESATHELVLQVVSADCYPMTDPTLGYDPANPDAPPWVPKNIGVEIKRLWDLEPLTIDLSNIRSLALLNVDEAQVVEHARKTFTADSQRAQRSALFKGVLAALENLMLHRPEHCDRVAAAYRDTDLYQYIPSEG